MTSDDTLHTQPIARLRKGYKTQAGVQRLNSLSIAYYNVNYQQSQTPQPCTCKSYCQDISVWQFTLLHVAECRESWLNMVNNINMFYRIFQTG